MNVDEILSKLESLGTSQTKEVYIRHGAKEPLYGVKVGDLKKLVKHVKKDQDLAFELYDTGNSDAMYLAGLSVNPNLITKKRLQDWAEKANWYMLSEHTVAGVAAESPYALELAREWMSADEENIASSGWATFSNYISITPDEQLPIEEIRTLLQRVKDTVHTEPNRVRYTMNGFVISVGSYIPDLQKEALAIADSIGKVEVNVGQTACKVPLATQYIKKVADKGKLGIKRKTCIC
ncbi:DNA alkylation repair protein [Bacillus sp. HMF5848]|uniref:DNA alkylation repair protein n=1 Tax=Bacillus sp. HMF5848 TaxID=2495421 RepID=UPI000F7738BD|nr:DNA alkylation repair protein [Bacillus sp. HMF5848]RSK28103.1 DNA alkylation repair protein [Bacillus sp. HMF5848]